MSHCETVTEQVVENIVKYKNLGVRGSEFPSIRLKIKTASIFNKELGFLR